MFQEQKDKTKELLNISDDFIDNIHSVVKMRKGIKSDVRDDYIMIRLLSALMEIGKQKSIIIDENDCNHLIFLADYTVWQYDSFGNHKAMPEDLRYRLNNLLIKDTINKNEVV
jgi:hypothetical protein